MISRIAQNAQAVIKVELYVGGVLTNALGGVTIEVLREDDTVLVASTAATNSGTGVYSYTLTPTHTANLDVLEARWTASNFNGATQIFTTYAEVVGGFHFTVAEAKALRPLDQFTVNEIIEGRTLAESALEDVCGAFVPRYAREIFSGSSAFNPQVLIVRERILRVVAANLDGIALTSGELADLIIDRDAIYRLATWPSGYQNIELKYWHGFEHVPPLVKRASLRLTRRYLVESPIDDRATRVTQEGATIEFLASHSLPFDIPEVNSVVKRYGQMAVRLT